jgi:hypothetical protein
VKAIKNIAGVGLILLSLLMIIFMVIGLLEAIKLKGLGSSDAAGWVQAIGVVFAIGATCGAAAYQSISDRRTAAEQQEKSYAISTSLCYEVAKDVCAAVKASTEKMAAHPPHSKFTFSTERLEGLQTALQNILIRDMPTELYRPMLRLQTQVTYSLVAIRRRNGQVKTISNANILSAHQRVTTALGTRDYLKQLYLKYKD